MGKYTGPKVKIIRRLGLLPGLTQKLIKNKKKTPGQHGKIVFLRQKRTSLSDEYKLRLFEKQKLKFNYGVSEKQLYAYYKEAKRLSGSTGLLLLELLESRLDSILYRGGFAPTIPAARQIINHNHILVNNKKVNIASFLCKINDIITVRESLESKKVIKTNLEKILLTRQFLFERLQKSNILWKFYNLVIPKHIQLNKENLSLKIVSPIKRNNILIKINELKVIEFYSK